MLTSFVQSLFGKKNADASVPVLAVWNAAFQPVNVNGIMVAPGASVVLTNVSAVEVTNVAKKRILQTKVPGPAVTTAPQKRSATVAPWGILVAAHDFTRPSQATLPSGVQGPVTPLAAMVFSGFRAVADGSALQYMPGPSSPMAGKDVRVMAAQTGSWLPHGFVGMGCGAGTVPPNEFSGPAPLPSVVSGVNPGPQGLPSAVDYPYATAPCAMGAAALAAFPTERAFGSMLLTQAQTDASPLWLSVAGKQGPVGVFSSQAATAQASADFQGLQLPAGTEITAAPRVPLTLRETDAVMALGSSCGGAKTGTATNALLDTLGFVHELPWTATPTQVASMSYLNASLAPVSDAAECRKKDIQRYNFMLDRLVDLKLGRLTM